MEYITELAGTKKTAGGEASEQLVQLPGEGLGRVGLQAILRQHLWPALFVAAGLVAVTVGVWSSGYPRGADTWGHIFRAEYIARQMNLDGLSAYFKSAWLPAWYMGDPLRTYYPPLTALALAPLISMVGEVALAYRLAATLLLVGLAGLTFLYVSLEYGRWQAALAAVLAIWAPYQLRTLYFEGNLPRMLAVLTLPLLALFTERLLRTKAQRVPLAIALGAIWAVAILAHPQQAAMFAIGFCSYIVVRLFLDPEVPLLRGGEWILALVLGGALAAPWAIPAYGRGELANVPFLPVEKVDLFSASIRSLLPAATAADGRILFGAGVILLALLAAAARPDPRRTAWVISGAITLWLSLGPDGVAFALLPFHNQLLPERFLNFSAFALAIAASGLLPIGNRAQVARVLVLASLVFIDLYPNRGILSNRAFPTAEANLSAAIAAHSSPEGRVALLTLPEPTSIEVYYVGQVSHLVNGWALENTPHNPALRRFPSAAVWGPGYFERLLGIWNVDTVVLAGERSQVDGLTESLGTAGFLFRQSVDRYEIWSRSAPLSPVQVLPESRALVLGDKIGPFLGAYPFAEESEVELLSELSDEALSQYPALLLYRFEESVAGLEEDERRLLQYIADGGTAIVDLSGMEDKFGLTLEFLGIQVLRLSLVEEAPLRWSPEAPDGLPQALSFEAVSREGWSGATYSGLDEVLAEIQYGDEWYPILGYRDIGRGRIWFVGMNLFFYAQQTGRESLTTLIRDLTLEQVEVSTSTRFEPLSVSDWSPTSGGLVFALDASEPVAEALISYTYSPRWRVLMDGEEISAGSYENLLKLSIPRGKHAFAVEYQPFGTLWPLFGLSVGGIGVAAAGAAYWIERRRFLPAMEMPATSSVRDGSKEYAPCANCSFLIAEVGAPTAETYPFQVVFCPVCGMRMDDDGFDPGKQLSDEEKREALDKWLELNGYDPETVHSRWGFAPEDFFGASEGGEPSPIMPLGGEVRNG